MVKKWLSMIGLLGALASIGSAQEATQEATQDAGRMANPVIHVNNPVASVELVKQDDSYVLVLKGDLPDGCDVPTTVKTEHVGEAWFVDLYRELPFDAMCPAVLKSYEEQINISDLFDIVGQAQQIIVINGKIYSLEAFDPASEPVVNDLWARGPLPYERIVLTHTPEGDMTITLSGTLTDGCALPVYRAVPDWQNEGFTSVEAFTAISLNAMCAQVLTPFEVTMTTPVFQSLAINGVSVPFDPALSKATQEFLEQPLSITTATAEWVEGILPNIKITVTGITDGCEVPIQMVPQVPVDNSYLIKVVRVLPADMACTKIARDFTQELMLAPQLVGDTPVMLFIGDQMITLE